MSAVSEWKDVNVSKKKQNSKSITEEIYILSNMLRNGACLRCINRSCKINEPHGEPFPDKISNFVHYPLYINGLNEIFTKANLDFNGKQPFYTICNYLMGKCKNCMEGRVKYVDFNNDKLAICYPSLERDNNKITIGMHIDIKLILRGKKYEVLALPFDVILPKKEEEINQELYLNGEIVNTKEEWPSLDGDHKRKRIASPVMSFAHIKESFKNDIPFYPINEKISKTENFDLKIETEYVDDLIKGYKNREYDLLDELDYFRKKYDNLLDKYDNVLDELEHFKKRHSDIEFENYRLKNDMDHLRRTSNQNINNDVNNDVYDEILYNMDNINTRVTNQFLKTEYSEYILL